MFIMYSIISELSLSFVSYYLSASKWEACYALDKQKDELKMSTKCTSWKKKQIGRKVGKKDQKKQCEKIWERRTIKEVGEKKGNRYRENNVLI